MFAQIKPYLCALITVMLFNFYKYHGTGNDFILADNRQDNFSKNDTKLISRLCDRHFGIGADGLILIEMDDTSDFHMVYFNADGKPGSMCGNGARCAVAFAHEMGMIGEQTHFRAYDGLHAGEINGDKIRIQLNDVGEIREKPDYFFLNTGSPHHVQLCKSIDDLDVKNEGEKLRYGLYGKKGSNINFVEQLNSDTFRVRTYERGVENETFSCGTGVTAVALAMHHGKVTSSRKVKIRTRGGDLQVDFDQRDGSYFNIYLSGPAKLVFKGSLEC